MGKGKGKGPGGRPQGHGGTRGKGPPRATSYIGPIGGKGGVARPAEPGQLFYEKLAELEAAWKVACLPQTGHWDQPAGFLQSLGPVIDRLATIRMWARRALPRGCDQNSWQFKKLDEIKSKLLRLHDVHLDDRTHTWWAPQGLEGEVRCGSGDWRCGHDGRYHYAGNLWCKECARSAPYIIWLDQAQQRRTQAPLLPGYPFGSQIPAPDFQSPPWRDSTAASSSDPLVAPGRFYGNFADIPIGGTMEPPPPPLYPRTPASSSAEVVPPPPPPPPPPPLSSRSSSSGWC